MRLLGRKKTLLAVGGCACVTLLIAGVVLTSCEKTPPLPAKTIAGTWVSPAPVFFLSLTDSCTGIYAVNDCTAIVMKWTISYEKDNLVKIGVAATSRDFPISLSDSCHAPHQYSFPDTLHGVVGGTAMIVEKGFYTYDTLGRPILAYQQLGRFYYETNSMSGDLTSLVCDTVHCRGYKTRSGAISLVRE